MQTRLLISSLGIAASTALAQGTFIYDQQSSTNEAPQPYGSGGPIQQGVVQSFTPTQSSIDFIKLKLNDGFPSTGVGASVYINLRATSITGPVLGSTDPVFMPNGFTGVTNFAFSTPVSIAPGTTYYFEPIVQAGGDMWNIDGEEFNYSGGLAFYQGVALSGSDLWFREGIVVPEPATGVILLVGIAAAVRLRRRKSGPYT